MDNIKSICLISMLAGIIGAIIPRGKMKTAFSSLCSVLLVFNIVLPIAGIKAVDFKKISFEKENSEEMLLADVKTAEIMLYEQLLEKALEEKFEQADMKLSLESECEKTGDEIRVRAVRVAGCESEEDRLYVEKILKDSFSGVQVEFEEEGNGGT